MVKESNVVRCVSREYERNVRRGQIREALQWTLYNHPIALTNRKYTSQRMICFKCKVIALEHKVIPYEKVTYDRNVIYSYNN